MSTSILELEQYSVRYGQAVAVSDVWLRVSPGQIVTIVGPNGAGKSSLLNAVMGLIPATGDLRFGASCTSRSSLDRRVVEGMSLVPESRELFGSLSVEDNLRLGAYLRRKQHRLDVDSIYAAFPRLLERRRQLAGTLSGGERQMLAIGRALMARPSLLMLDEPSLGLAPLIVREVLDMVVELRHRGMAILLVEQNARAALKIADHAYVLESGCVVMEGKASKLVADPRIAKTYLGSGASNNH
jgi:branched-chain amino acid transport system ATP-binding protein